MDVKTLINPSVKAIQVSLISQPDPELKIHQDIAQISVIIAKEIKALNHIKWQLTSQTEGGE